MIYRIFPFFPNGVITRYLTDTQNPTGYVQVLEELNGAYGVQRRYVYGLDLISMADVLAGKTYYYGYDAAGSTRLLTDEAGDIAAVYDYDAFGTLIYTLNLDPGTLSNPYNFHSEYRDPITGLVYLRARWYEPDTGRFVSMDEFEGIFEKPITINKYIAFNLNPINSVDPRGYFAVISDIKWGSRIRRLLKGVFETGDKISVGVEKVPAFEKIGFDVRHTSIGIRMDNGNIEKVYASISEYVLHRDYGYMLEHTNKNMNPNNLGRLIKRVRLGNVEMQASAYYIEIPQLSNMSDREIEGVLQQISKTFRGYQNNARYSMLPIYGEGVNSNSFTGSLLRKSGINLPMPYNAYGWYVNMF